MPPYQLKARYKKILADTTTPVSIYLKIRDKYPNTVLLESSDYHGTENIFSYICCHSIAGLHLEDNTLTMTYPDGKTAAATPGPDGSLSQLVDAYIKNFSVEDTGLPFITNGLFGYTSFDAVRHFEEIQIKSYETPYRRVPDMMYYMYRFVLAFNHFNNELHIIETRPEQEPEDGGMDELLTYIESRKFAMYPFSLIDREESNFTDEEFLEVIKKGQEHCRRGDVFQIVLSRRFSRQFQGDEFNVYRSLRSINPSPYLFYFDFGSFRIFGSSPEAQIVVKKGKATIYPIAGTFRRTGNDIHDYDLAKKLLADPKENSEHVMLVDLARNDLSRHCSHVKVETYKEIQYYSHVIHMVSKVTGQMNPGTRTMDIVADTFPAGTLSGAPKHMAMQLINKLEHGNRGVYAGCIGHMGFQGDFNHAITIRTFLSKDNILFYQAGAGVVAMSTPENELQEVHNKLAALKRAIELAEGV